MATIDTSTPARYAEMYGDYSGFSAQAVGLGTVPGSYASDEYAAKKTDTLLIGIPSKTVYGAFDTDPQPLMVPLFYEAPYNTLMSLNLRYAPAQIRQQIMAYILQSNEARIRSNQPMLIDWNALARAVPAVRMMTRRYKLQAIRLQESYSLESLPRVLTEKSPFENIYKQRN